MFCFGGSWGEWIFYLFGFLSVLSSRCRTDSAWESLKDYFNPWGMVINGMRWSILRKNFRVRRGRYWPWDFHEDIFWLHRIGNQITNKMQNDFKFVQPCYLLLFFPWTKNLTKPEISATSNWGDCPCSYAFCTSLCNVKYGLKPLKCPPLTFIFFYDCFLLLLLLRVFWFWGFFSIQDFLAVLELGL